MKIINEYYHINLQDSPEELRFYINTERTKLFSAQTQLRKDFTCEKFQFYEENDVSYVHYNPLNVDLKVIPQNNIEMPLIGSAGKVTLTISYHFLDFKWNYNKQKVYEQLWQEVICRLPEKMSVNVSWKVNGREITVFRRFKCRALRLKRKKYS